MSGWTGSYLIGPSSEADTWQIYESKVEIIVTVKNILEIRKLHNYYCNDIHILYYIATKLINNCVMTLKFAVCKIL